MNDANDNLTEVRRECVEFTDQCESVLLATRDRHGETEVGYSPFVRLNDEFYVYLSGSSVQTDSMLASGEADLMFIEDELSSGYVFARQQLSFECSVSVVPRGYEYTRVMVALQEKMRYMLDLLRRVPGYQLFRMTPRQGIFVNKDAQEYTFSGTRAEALHHSATYVRQENPPAFGEAS